MEENARQYKPHNFKYEKLANPEKDIRLLAFCNGPNSRPIRLSIVHYDPEKEFIAQKFTKPVEYQALSYAWGDASRKLPIYVNGKYFYVTENLEAALEHLLRMDSYKAMWERTERFLWIDAICIDQFDLSERDAQVQRMRSIYEQAEKVIIWLGIPATPTMSDAYSASELMKYLSALFEMSILTLDWGKGSKIQNAFLSLGDPDMICDGKIWTYLSSLFKSSWFERLWVIQELAASMDAVVLWGQIEIPWKRIEASAKYILRPDTTPPPPEIRRLLPLMGAHHVVQVAVTSIHGFDRTNVLAVLHQTQQAKCADPRDKLYGILGVVEYTEGVATSGMLQVDYSLPVGVLYRQFALAHIQQTGLLDILGACANSSRSGDLPSWVPDFRNPWGQDKQLWSSSNNWSYRSWISHINDCSSYSRSPVPYKYWWKIPSAKNEKTVQVSENGLEIQMLATGWSFITALSDIGDAVSTLEKFMSIKEKLVEILDRWEEWATSHVPWNTHFKDVILRIELESDKKRAARLSADYDLIYGKAGARKVLTPACVDAFERELFPRIHGCQLYTTEDGAIGIVAGNCGAQIGDEIKFLRRGLTHFVVRKKDRGYQLISPCYHALVTPRGWEERITLI